MNNPKVSVLIPVYNAEKWVRKSIQSVINQSYKNIELIMVDDGSTDKSLEVIKEYKDNNIHVFSQKNKGAAAARNFAFCHSNGDFIQYLDADDILADNKIEQQMIRLRQQSENSLASGPFYEFTTSIDKSVSNPDQGYRDYDKPLDWLINAALDKAMFPPIVWLTPRILIEKTGPWNEQLSYNDDPEFFARVLLNANKITFCFDSKSYYRRGLKSSLGSRNDGKAIESRLLSLDLVSEYLLNAKDTQRTREACAYQYRKFIYSIYPEYAGLRNKATNKLKAIGVKGKYNFGDGISAKLSKLIGWKTVKWVRYFYNIKKKG